MICSIGTIDAGAGEAIGGVRWVTTGAGAGVGVGEAVGGVGSTRVCAGAGVGETAVGGVSSTSTRVCAGAGVGVDVDVGGVGSMRVPTVAEGAEGDVVVTGSPDAMSGLKVEGEEVGAVVVCCVSSVQIRSSGDDSSRRT